MQGLAKTSETPSKPAPNTPFKDAVTSMNDWGSYKELPLTFYRYFGVDFGKVDSKTHTELNDVYNYVKTQNKTKSMGEILNKVKRLEIKLGAPNVGQSRVSKVWNYVKMSQHINDLEAQREAFRR